MELQIETNAVAVMASIRGQLTTALKHRVRALNRAIGSGRTLLVRETARDMGLTQTVVRNAIRLQDATAARPEASLRTSLKRIPLSRFHARQTKSGVRYRLPGGRGGHPTAFLATMRSGHEGVFVRRPKGQLGPRGGRTKELFGPSIGGVVRKYRDQAVARIQEQFAKNFKHEMEFARQQQGTTGA